MGVKTLEEARQRLAQAEQELDEDDGRDRYRSGQLRVKVGHWEYRVRLLERERRRQQELFAEFRE